MRQGVHVHAFSRLAVAGAGVALATLTTVGNPAISAAQTNQYKFFVSPSGNIACVIAPDTIRCDITESDWPRPPRPADCQNSYGHMVGINPYVNPDGPAQFLCAGDSAHGSDIPLAYGNTITAGPMQCDSAESGITCRNVVTRHGFSISRAAYQLF
jgi:hypothetical protein